MKPTMQFKWFEVSGLEEGPTVTNVSGLVTSFYKLRQLWTDGMKEEWRDIEVEWAK